MNISPGPDTKDGRAAVFTDTTALHTYDLVIQLAFAMNRAREDLDADTAAAGFAGACKRNRSKIRRVHSWPEESESLLYLE